MNNPTTSEQPDNTRSSLLLKDQLAQIQIISTRSVEELVAEIASNAASSNIGADQPFFLGGRKGGEGGARGARGGRTHIEGAHPH